MNAQYYNGSGTGQRAFHQPTSTDTSPFRHFTRSWNNNGVQCRLDAATYNTPTFSLGLFGGTMASVIDETLFGNSQRPRTQPLYAEPPRSVFGGSTIGKFLKGNRPDLETATSTTTREHLDYRPKVEIVDDDPIDDNHYYEHDDYDPDDDYEVVEVEYIVRPGNRGTRRRNVLSRIKGKLQGQTQHRRRHVDARSPSIHSAEFVILDDNIPNEYDAHYRDDMHEHHRADQDLINGLERAVDHHRRQVKGYQREIGQASRRMVSSSRIQDLLDGLKREEHALAHATDDLLAAKKRQRQSLEHEQRAQSRSRPRSHTSPLMYEHETFQPFGRHRMHSNFSTFGGFPGFNDLFPSRHESYHDFYDPEPLRYQTFHSSPFEFFTGPGGFFRPSQRGGPFRESNDRPRGNPHEFERTSPMENIRLQPPPNLLTSAEVKQLFEVYNNRWSMLSPTDPLVPYPARGLQADALNSRDTIWAPNVASHPTTWSEESIMQVNVQSFFLLAAGLDPVYTDGPSGQIEMAFECRGASAEQVKNLIEMLKKEKMRWHSDRLGRRNGGLAGVNEELQRDDRARAVFHAVCGLMETAQSVKIVTV